MGKSTALAAFTLLSLWAAPNARGASPLDELIAPAAGATACFVRVYDEAHLRRVPRQQSTGMTIWLKYREGAGGAPGVILGLGLAINRRADAEPLFAQGDCIWEKRANRDTSDRRLIKTYKKDPGAICVTSARPDVFDTVSAEEGGALIFDRGANRDTLMVYLDDRLTMVKRADRAKQLDIQFGPDDRVFQLRRTDLKDCDFVERALSR